SDLVYPHHENEIAQSESATGKRPFARFWVHVAPMRLGGKKMSKSDGNMVFVRDALARMTPQALRLYLLDVHYRRPFDHDEARLARAVERAARLAATLGGGPFGPVGSDPGTRAVLAAVDDDLHTDRAIRTLERVAPPADDRARAGLRATGVGYGRSVTVVQFLAGFGMFIVTIAGSIGVLVEEPNALYVIAAVAILGLLWGVFNTWELIFRIQWIDRET